MTYATGFTIGNEFIRIEGYGEVQVIVNHNLEGFTFYTFAFIFINWFAVQITFRAEAVTVNTTACR